MNITYPYLPPNRSFLYVAAEHPHMVAAKNHAREHSLDATVPTGSVVVVGDMVVGRGANGSTYHEDHGCERVRQGVPTGQRYDLCEGCHPKNHSELRAIADAQAQGHQLAGASLYLWGHWWACQDCWEAIIAAGITDVFLVAGSEKLFNRDHPDNSIGRQFA